MPLSHLQKLNTLCRLCNKKLLPWFEFQVKAAVPSVSHLHYRVTCGADDLEHYVLM
jgi:hypothetical protein